MHISSLDLQMLKSPPNGRNNTSPPETGQNQEIVAKTCHFFTLPQHQPIRELCWYMSWSHTQGLCSLNWLSKMLCRSPLGSLGSLSTSCPRLHVCLTKHCTSLHHHQVSVDCFYCILASGFKFWYGNVSTLGQLYPKKPSSRSLGNLCLVT